MLAVTADAQVSISIKDVAKIHFTDGAGYLGGYYKNEYDLLPGNGQWSIYQTHESYSRYNHKNRYPKSPIEQKDSAEYKFVKNFPADSISLFLKTLRVIKPKFDPAALHIALPQLVAAVDSQLKNLDTKHLQLFNSFFNTPAKLYHVLDTMQHDYWTDDRPYSVVEIIKKNGDTVKVYTTQQVDYMLPWNVNGVPSYDVAINYFFMGVTGLYNHRMSGHSISYRVRDCVDFLYARDAFERLRWQENSPQSLEYIQKHFVIVKVNQWNDDTQVSLQPKVLNKHVIINSRVNFNNNAQLTALTRFATDTLKQLLKKGGFIIDSCMHKRGCTINFSNSHAGYFDINPKNIEAYLSKYDRQQLVFFSITAGARVEDDWIALPDGNFLLTAYLDHYAVGIPAKYIDQQRTGQRWFVCMLFSANGQLIAQEN